MATTYSITPNPVTVGEGAGTPDLHDHPLGGTSSGDDLRQHNETEGSANNGDYTAILNQGVSFTLGQTTAHGGGDDPDDTAVESSETFGFIVQRNASDPVTTYLAKPTFTITDNDVQATTYAITPNPATVGEGAGTQTFTITRWADRQRRRSMRAQR